MTIKVLVAAKTPNDGDVTSPCSMFVDGLEMSVRAKVKK
jgi:hypothetical protein